MRFLPPSILVLLATLHAGAALAHAHLRSASPPADATVQAAPDQVAITYSEGVEPRFSSIEVQDASGKRVDKQDPHLVNGDNKVLAVGLPALPPGTYKVIWRATAVDTHKTDGSFSFTVKP